MRSVMALGLFLVVALLISPAFAGVGGVEPVVPAAAAQGETGSLGGVVFSYELAPIPGALMDLLQNGTVEYATVTSDSGHYSFPEVVPGAYLLVASAHGYVPQSEPVEIAAGEHVTRNFLLQDQVPAPEPWVHGPNSWTGFISCTLAGLQLCHDGVQRLILEVEPGIRTISVGLDWDSGALTSADELVLEVRAEPIVLAAEQGAPGFEIRLDHEDIPGKTLDEDPWIVEFRIFPPLMESLLVYQQPFTLWWTFHYWAEAPDGYSTFPPT